MGKNQWKRQVSTRPMICYWKQSKCGRDMAFPQETQRRKSKNLPFCEVFEDNMSIKEFLKVNRGFIHEVGKFILRVMRDHLLVKEETVCFNFKCEIINKIFL